MDIQVEARIFLEGRRGLFQTDGFRSFRTFNFGDYQAEGREAFGKLLVVNDETLLAQCEHEIKVNEFCEIILIPLVGGIEVHVEKDSAEFVNSGEALRFFANPDQTYVVINPYPQEMINYLQIRLSTEYSKHDKQLSEFNLLHKNTLQPVFSGGKGEVNIYVGKYGGREEGVYSVSNPGNGVFVFVIEGAFEIQNRLMERRDGLSLRNVEIIEFEALSQDAMLLLVEIKMIS
jgi:succinate dehydrogenase flavin-adding protein (antitoxin of CptAB toxin-antitoxin module)